MLAGDPGAPRHRRDARLRLESALEPGIPRGSSSAALLRRSRLRIVEGVFAPSRFHAGAAHKVCGNDFDTDANRRHTKQHRCLSIIFAICSGRIAHPLRNPVARQRNAKRRPPRYEPRKSRQHRLTVFRPGGAVRLRRRLKMDAGIECRSATPRHAAMQHATPGRQMARPWQALGACQTMKWWKVRCAYWVGQTPPASQA